MILKSKNAFTLIELLVVIAIIGLLATISIVALSNARSRARDARRLSDIKQMQTAIEMYYQYNGYYPQYNNFSHVCSTATNNSLSALVNSGLMTKIPIDPINDCSNNPRFGYDYIGIGNASNYLMNSAYYCNGKSRTDYQWALLFSLEGDNSEFFRLTNSGGTPIDQYTHCIHGPLRLGF